MTLQVMNETQRRAARRILRGRGLPTSEVHRMSYAALTAALVQHGVGEAEYGDAVAAEVNGAGRPVPGKPEGTPQPGNGADEPSGEGDADGKADADGESEADGGKSGGKSDDPLEARVRQLARDEISKAEAKAEKKAPAVSKADVDKAVSEALAERVPQPVRVELPGEPPKDVEGVVHFKFPVVLKALAAGTHVWMPGPAGSGKSTLARQVLDALGYSASQIFMTGAIETPYELKGYNSPSGDRSTLLTPLRRSIEAARETGKGAFIFDDVDRSNPKALAAFNELLANGHGSFPDGMVEIPAGWLCIATANTFGLGGGSDYVGAGRLDKATLDRFVFIEIPYDEKCERAIAGEAGREWCAHVQKVRAACVKLGLKHLVTPRATFKGLKLLAAGMSDADVAAATVYAGLDAETLARVRGAL